MREKQWIDTVVKSGDHGCFTDFWTYECLMALAKLAQVQAEYIAEARDNLGDSHFFGGEELFQKTVEATKEFDKEVESCLKKRAF